MNSFVTRLKQQQHIIAILTTALIFPSSTLADSPVVNYQYQVIAEYPHSESFFTQGLEFYQGVLYESSGMYGESALQTRQLDATTPILRLQLDKQYFGEGITVLNDTIYQLTWKSKLGFIYSVNNLSSVGKFSINGEGWGLTNNGKQLIYSDGSNRLRFLNPTSFTIEKTISVTYNGKAVIKLNELEWVEGLIYANIWQSNWIVIINPDNGNIVGKVRLNQLLPAQLRTRKTDVLNGIAYDKKLKRLFVTGKYWPRLYHIELKP